MSDVKKACPVCGKEFFVLKKAEEKAVYCTLACLIKAQVNLNPEVLPSRALVKHL